MWLDHHSVKDLTMDVKILTIILLRIIRNKCAPGRSRVGRELIIPSRDRYRMIVVGDHENFFVLIIQSGSMKTNLIRIHIS